MSGNQATVDLYESTVRELEPHRAAAPQAVTRVRPQTLDELTAILAEPSRYPSPVRPVGSGSARTRANATAAGTLVEMGDLNRILQTANGTVTVEAGITVRDLAEELAADGLELVGACAEPQRTVGGAVSSVALGSGVPGVDSSLAASVVRLSLINSSGRRVEVGPKLPDLLRLARTSFGLLGIVYSVTLRVRPVQRFALRTARMGCVELCEWLPELVAMQAGIRAIVLPHRRKAWVEMRLAAEGRVPALGVHWKLRDWARHSAAPRLIQSVGKCVPLRGLRDPLIDGINGTTQRVFNNPLGHGGSNAVEQSGRFRRLDPARISVDCTWLFPAAAFAAVLRGYINFADRHYARTGYRCDLPTELVRVDKDDSSLLSPAHDETLFAMQLRSTANAGWQDFLLELAEFAAGFGGIPAFNQTPGLAPGCAARAYGTRLAQFRIMRERLDPDGRLLNQYFAEHIG